MSVVILGKTMMASVSKNRNPQSWINNYDVFIT